MDASEFLKQDPDKAKSRLYWRCRRGMLELDYLLQNYLEKNYPVLSAVEIRDFTDLLETPDNLLLEYLMGRTVPDNSRMKHVVQKIRSAAEH